MKSCNSLLFLLHPTETKHTNSTFICHLFEEHLSHSFSFSFLCFTSNLLWFMEGHFTRTLIRALMVYSKMFLPLLTQPLLVHWTSMAVCCGCGQLSAELRWSRPAQSRVKCLYVITLCWLLSWRRKGRDTRLQFYLEFFLEGLLMKIQKFVIVVSNFYLYLLIIDMI